MSDLLKRLKKVNTLKEADVLKNSRFFVEDYHDTGIPALNIAMSGSVDGGYSKGSTLIGGESATFKTLFCFQMAKAHLENFKDSIFVFFDIEHGSNLDTFDSMGLDTSRIYHKPFTTIEELTHDIALLLEELTVDDEVVFVVDSLGAANTKKAIDDSRSGNSAADFTKAKAIKRFWNIVNPELNVKKLSMFAVAQVYDSMEMYGKPVFGGGKANYYMPNNRWLVTKSKETELVKGKKEKIGSIFTVNIEKSRLIKEGSKFPISVTWNGGINKYSSLLEIARATGHVTVPTQGWYSKDGGETKLRKKDLDSAEFWDSILDDESFHKAVKDRYSLGSLKGEPVEIDVEQDIDQKKE